ncbi:PREDICTED: glutaredoxin-1-like [Pterocles gutturalis]|uniref:glutaredoxin-1-like n=1 Tax=Pterocles gutturalis TaxID=240206 RepID=UPI00052933EE|nr:PREDICTED: glutaredoxin-1-like [Pterocles gutturalis]
MAEQFVRNTISDGKVTVFVRGGCPYCRNAVEMLMWVGVSSSLLDQPVAAQEQGRDFSNCCLEALLFPVVPCVFFGTECIGGLRDLISLRRNLPRILQHIGAIRS